MLASLTLSALVAGSAVAQSSTPYVLPAFTDLDGKVWPVTTIWEPVTISTSEVATASSKPRIIEAAPYANHSSKASQLAQHSIATSNLTSHDVEATQPANQPAYTSNNVVVVNDVVTVMTTVTTTELPDVSPPAPTIVTGLLASLLSKAEAAIPKTATSWTLATTLTRSAFNGQYAIPTSSPEPQKTDSSTGSDGDGIVSNGFLHEDSLTCNFDQFNKVTISGIKGEWGKTLEATLKACHHELKGAKLHFQKLEGATQMFDFTVTDMMPNQTCIETGIRIAGGALGPEGCTWAMVPEGYSPKSPTADEPIPYPRPQVKVNVFRDGNSHNAYFEVYGIRDWRLPDYASHAWPFVPKDVLTDKFHKGIEKCGKWSEPWRQALDVYGFPVFMFGWNIASDKEDCVKDAIAAAGGPNKWEVTFNHIDQKGDFYDWAAKWAPFRYFEHLMWFLEDVEWPQITIDEAKGYSKDGGFCLPKIGKCYYWDEKTGLLPDPNNKGIHW